MKFLIVGCGSIGQRHINNLLRLGVNDLEIHDSNKALLKHIGRKFKIKTLSSLKFNDRDCTLICTPPSNHLELATNAIKNNSHVFIEKPLGNSLKGLTTFSKLAKKKSLNVFVGYVFRFDLGLNKIKELLARKEIGNILSFDAYEGWYLPNWRPWQNYTKSYTSSRRLGGGIILDGSHELNYLQWLGGKINQVFSYYTVIPKLKVKTEGLAEILMTFQSGSIGRIHLDFVNPKYNRHCEIIGDEGSIKWSFEEKTLEILKNNKIRSNKIKYGKDNNEMYVNEMKYVIDCIKGKQNTLLNLEDAVKTLEISLAIKKSGKLNRPVWV